jgi:hypothetical protein
MRQRRKSEVLCLIPAEGQEDAAMQQAGKPDLKLDMARSCRELEQQVLGASIQYATAIGSSLGPRRETQGS